MQLLNVPLVRQAEYSWDCGVACVAMLFEFYGIPYGYDRLKKEIGVFRFGTFIPQLGLQLLKAGFKVEIVTMHPALFTLLNVFTDKQQLIDHFKKIRKTVPHKHDEIGLDFFVKFVQSGGILTPRVPLIRDIQEEIDLHRPVLCSLTHRFLFKSDFRPKFSFHFNIITGYDAEKIYVNDPDWEDGFGGKYMHVISDYLYAIYASAYGFIDGASIMKVDFK